MRGILGVIAFIAIAQGLGGFIGRMWFDREWGFLHRVVGELPLWGYLGVAVAGVAVAVAADRAKKREG
ncbi:hypothetical protein [Nonomuraea aridisoli]|uniref:Uncharacterized protein n=1 Tax=Nonomuraea aridisoli TaxID=2070368 RepID=A0A2W2F0X0_9ACTN|nr:hypothetical protein [Nonomuraea aridisoli]PZG15227.1 hypothetical protein C1J01_24720 [Nonomuraea aridisoli]